MLIDQELFLNYLTLKAVQQGVLHDPENNKKAVHVIDDPYNLGEFDEALRNFASFPAMLLEEGGGGLDDNNSSNYTDTKDFSFMIIDKRNGTEAARAVRARCLAIGQKILVQIRKDCNAMQVVPGKYITMRLDDCPYVPVGPMDTKYYGYMFSLRFICPFSF